MTPQNNNSKKPPAPHALPVFDEQKVEMHTMQQDIKKTKPEINSETAPKIEADTKDEQIKPEIPTPPKPPTTPEIPLIKDSIKLPEKSPEKKVSPFDRFRKPKEAKESSTNISKFKDMLPKTTAEEADETPKSKDFLEKEVIKAPPIEKNTQTPSAENDLEIKIPGERSKLPIFIIIAASLVVLVAGGAFWYYLFFVKDNTPTTTETGTKEKEQPAVIKIPEQPTQEVKTPEATPATPKKKEIPEPQIPASSIYFDQTIITSVDEKNKSKLIENLRMDSSQLTGKGTVTRHLFKISNPNEKSFIPTIEFLKTIGIIIPSDVVSEINSIEFVSYKIDSKTRYGIIAKISTKEKVLAKMKDWENKAISDLKQLFMGESLILPEDPKFSENEYLDFIKRYINLSSTDLSLDYAVSDKFLIIATSKDMMYALILQTQK